MPDKVNTVIVEVEGGVVQDVRNLPPGWTWELLDHDMDEDEEEEEPD